MRKSADVVILMQPSSNLSLLFPQSIDWEQFSQYRPEEPFSDKVLEYLNSLSSALLKDRNSRMYPDVVTFAFFCRKGNLLQLKDKYRKGSELRLGRGVLFHIAPSNVPINFAYSLVAGLLAGNANVVRVSSKQFPQVDLVVRHILSLEKQEEYKEVSGRIALVRYDRTSDANAYFSSIANVRVIWGGDATIANIRQYSIPPRSFDVCFADRYSVAAIRPSAIMEAPDEEMQKLAENFYNDTYLFDQNACSAPHLVLWKKEVCMEEAKKRFWNVIHDYASKKYNLQAVLSVDKLTELYREAVALNCRQVPMQDNLVVRNHLNHLPSDVETYRCAGGLFLEYDMDGLDEIAPIVNEKYQTLAYYGFEKAELKRFVLQNRLKGLDRIVPIGQTTAFALTWDGYNLIETLSRVASIL